MSWENTVIANICGISAQVTDTTVKVGGQSIAGAETSTPNPLAGHRMWDRIAYFLTGASTTGGSMTVEVQGTVMNITGLPFARTVVDDAILSASPGGNQAIVIPSCNNSPYGLNPTQVLFDETVAMDSVAQVTALAKSKRGQIKSGTLNPQRVQEGVIASIPTPPPGRWAGATAGVSAGITQDTVINLTHTSATTGTTNWFVAGGLAQNALFDSALYFMDVTGASGTWNVYVRGVVNGNTVVIAGASGIGAGTTAAGATKIAFKSSTFGVGVKPTNFLFDVTTAGVSQSISGTIVYAAKTTKGQRLGR